MSSLPKVFQNSEQVDLVAMLNAREERSNIQQLLLSKLKHNDDGSLLLMTMAIPGPIKANKILNQAFNEVKKEVEKALESQKIIKKIKREEVTGLEFYVLSHLDSLEMKKRMVNIEENHPLGRLFDLDVLMLDQNNEVQGTSRTQLGLPVRRCFLCERPAKDCGRSRRHTVLELQEEISKRIQNYFKN